jgi:DNA-binding beta-propeller fold protein YncE
LLGSVLLHAVAVQAPACGSASPSSLLPTAGQRSAAPLAKVTFTRGGHHSVQMSDRVPIFDRVAFASPAAIVYDAERDLYWVSNLNGEGPKGKGFISRLEPTAERSTLNYIDGQKPGVTLESPRGLAVFGDVLYVADVKSVRKFKASTGESLGDIDIPGAALLTDVAVAIDGSLYVADVGGDPDEASLPDTGRDAVYQVSPTGQVSTVTQRQNLGGPYALAANETGLWVTCAGSNELLLLVPSADGSPVADAGRLPLPGGAPRGIVAMPDGTFVISNDAGSIYRGFRDGPFQPLLSDLELPADLGYDTRRQRLLIPLLGGHSLAIFELSPLPPAAAKP